MRRSVLVWALVWTVVVVLFISQNVLHDIASDRPVRWINDALFELLYWVPFVAATPFFTAMASRFAIDGDRERRDVVAHIAAGLAFAVVQPVVAQVLMSTAANWLLAPGDPRIGTFTGNLRRTYAALVLTAAWKYVVIIGVCLAVRYYYMTKEAQLRAAALERQVTAAQLAALKMQLHPHFLFNALHSAAMLTLVDPTRSHDVLVQLSDLLRMTLDTSGVIETPLRAELEFLDRYLAIERVRFEDRLSVRFDVAAGTEDLLVPSLILQPLVENALRHGLGPKAGAGRLVVRSRRVGDALELEVRDDGVGLPHGARDHRFGIGLTNVQDRVDAANQRPTPISIEGNGAGTRVRLRVPVRYRS